MVPAQITSKQNRTESGTTPESLPISRRTLVTVAPSIRSTIASTTLCVMDSSCISLPPNSADPRQRIAHEQGDDPGPAEGGVQQHQARRILRDPADDRSFRAERVRPQRG